MKIVLGMSGGVDSSVAAMLLKDAGHEVHGVYLDIGAASEAEAAQNVADALSIPLIVVDIRRELEERVCAPFVRAYLRGETPNPCVLCNPNVKFRALMEFADEIGASKIATGHYARVIGEGESAQLFVGSKNDQSYMLCRITRGQLGRLLLPLGDYDKSQVRELARTVGLTSADKPDSMEICFIPDGDYAAYIESRDEVPPEGDFIDADGNVLGRHGGIHRYTIGQSRGLGIALGQRMFITDIRRETNAIVLSPSGAVTETVTAGEFQYMTEDLPPIVNVRFRHTKTMASATAAYDGDRVLISLDTPGRVAAPGQAAALYSLTGQVLGGGIVSSS